MKNSINNKEKLKGLVRKRDYKDRREDIESL